MGWFTGLSLGLSLWGAARQAKAQREQGKAEDAAGLAEQRAANAQADLFDWNAGVADEQAADALQRGSEREGRFRQAARGMVAQQRTALAASGVDVSFGSAVEIQADSRYLIGLDAMMIRNNAAREAQGFRTEALDLRKRAEIAREEGLVLAETGRTRRKAAETAATTGLIGTGATLFQQKFGMTGSHRVAAAGA